VDDFYPSPQTTLFVLLGASEWPRHRFLKKDAAFLNAAKDVKTYFLKQFHLPDVNMLDLFDSEEAADDQDIKIIDFLTRRQDEMKKAGREAKDVLVYFIGHGDFAGSDQQFILAIRRIREENPYSSGLQPKALARTLKEKARNLRQIMIVDCCFAAAAYTGFQGGPDQQANAQFSNEFKNAQQGEGVPRRGTTLLCSSDQRIRSLILSDHSSTMFTKALLSTLTGEGGVPIQVKPQQQKLSLRELSEISRRFLEEMSPEAPRPALHSPDQSNGRIEDIPFFPNLWKNKRGSSPSQYRQLGPVGDNTWSAEPFDDTEAAKKLKEPLTKIRVYHGDIIDGIQAFYGSEQKALRLHGGRKTGYEDIVLEAEDVLIEVNGFYGHWFGENYILQLVFRTRNGKIHGPFGTTLYSKSHTPFSLRVDENERVIAFSGSIALGDNGKARYLGSIGLSVEAN